LRRIGSRNVRFVWAGAPTEAGQLETLRRLASELDVSDMIDFVGEQADLRPYFRTADVFVSSSREDPFPVVCLEAAAHGVPILCFDGAGGMPDFVKDDAGRVVPHLDVVAMAEAIAGLLDDTLARKRAGECARSRIAADHRVSVCGARLREIVCALMAPGGAV
jgi:glycosyltransferase involved in cell wall biosynthesis